MDFIIGLPKTQGTKYIYTMVENLAKFTPLFSITTNYSTKDVAYFFFKQYIRFHFTNNIVSYRDSRFMREFWHDLFKLAGTELTPNTSYHPKTGSQTEIMNMWSDGYLHNYVKS